MSGQQAQAAEWSKPYYGVSHLQGATRQVWGTVAEYGTFTEAFTVDFRRRPSDSPSQQFRTVAEARQWVEEQLGLLAA